jgi:aspartyl-tRNA(Asn)/glutamyl-tRNA(Gln) amidotransferase subunit C
MAISREDIEHVAFLARIGLTDDEKATLQEQLSSILEHMRTINELDTSQIPPTAQVIPLRNVMRPDEPEPSLPAEQVLQNAPDREGAFFRVPHILE